MKIKVQARLWLRRKDKPIALHEWNGSDTSCMSIQLKGLKLDNFEVTGKVYSNERICQACQTAIAERRGKL